jgi:hypothetical protein
MAETKDLLYNRYKLYSDEELKEITVVNGYTEDAEEVAQQILNGDRSEYEDHIRQQEEREKRQQEEREAVANENTVGGILKAIGILILIVGTIASIIIAGGDGYRYEFSFIRFIIPEVVSIVSGMVFIGFAEIIKLLQEIRDKL